MPTSPVLTSISVQATNVTLEWLGFGGPYHVQYKTSASDSRWQTIQTIARECRATVPFKGADALYQVTALPAQFGSARHCASCHLQTYQEWSRSSHAGAWEELRPIGFHTNSLCLPCHSTGWGSRTGFQTSGHPISLAHVQCENCHGAAGLHGVYADDPTLRPRVNIAAEICGGCHNDFHYPTYDEWASSGHRPLTPAVASLMATDRSSIRACGPCHAGTVRLALINGQDLPKAPVATAHAVTCAVCHEPHKPTPNGARLRHPIASTEFFSYDISPARSFASQYRPNIGLCAQCHNARGAAWTDTTQPPHPSPQYNLLLGNIGIQVGPPENSAHQGISRQCVQCHTHVYPSEDEAENARETGTGDHSFAAKPRNCAPCHSEESAPALIAVTQAEIRQHLSLVKEQLDTWALSKAPAELRQRYGALAWEYSRPGPLSNPTGDPTRQGPTATEQDQVPETIKQARFNLYLVVQDGSYGVHNGKYARYLLQVALDKVHAALSGP